MQARRDANSEMATSKEQGSLRFETRKTPLPPVAFTGGNKSDEREDTSPPFKLRTNAALR
jgi:hypothetical protein